MEKFIPLQKQQKKNQRAEYAKRRASWGGMSPVTRKSEKPSAYNRAKNKKENKNLIKGE